jgi:glycerol-3-phosphate dehydrogenase (NAD(P)+)
LTCSSEKSRNFRLGLLIGQGVPCDEALVQIGSVAEGVTTTKAAYELAQKLNVRAPITEVVYRALYEKLPVKDAARMLYTEKYEHQYEFEQIKEA